MRIQGSDMRLVQTRDGATALVHKTWPAVGIAPERELVRESLARGPHPGGLGMPGRSFLWVGQHHLDRVEVGVLAERLLAWLESGSLRGNFK